MSTVAEEHRATLGRLGDVFAHHTFEFDGETDADGSALLEGPPSAAQPLHHTNNTLKFLLTCCKAMVEASLSSAAASSSSHFSTSNNSAVEGVESVRKEFEGRLRQVEEEALRRHGEAAAAVQRLAADVDRRLGAVEASVAAAAAASAASPVSSTTVSAPAAPAESGGPKRRSSYSS